MTTQTTEKAIGPVATVQKLLEDNKRQIALALPKHLTMNRLIRTSLTSFQRNPKLLECHPATLGGAVMMCAIWGVEPIGPGGAWLVPFMNKKKNRMEVQFIVDYRGLANIARNSGEVKKVEWHEVHAKDSFTYRYGTDPKIEHTPYQGEGDAGALTHVYAVGFYKDGTAHFVVLTKEEALKAKKRSKAADFGPWQTDETAMCLKTAVRRICNQLPMSPEKQRMVAIEGKADIGVPQDLGTLIDPSETITDAETVENATQLPPPPERASEAANKSKNKTKEAVFVPEGVAYTELDGQAVWVARGWKDKIYTNSEEDSVTVKDAAKAGKTISIVLAEKDGKMWAESVAELKAK